MLYTNASNLQICVQSLCTKNIKAYNSEGNSGSEAEHNWLVNHPWVNIFLNLFLISHTAPLNIINNYVRFIPAYTLHTTVGTPK